MARRGKLSDARYDEIKKEILFMFEETETDTCPIDCFEIARKLHYILRPYSTLAWDDYLEALENSEEGYSKVEQDPVTGMNRYVIYYNDTGHGIRNIRWTIFHEIGHCYLGHHDNLPGNEQKEEAEANFFAKYAMCPPPLLYCTKCNCPQDVYDKFEASNEFSNYAYEYFQTWLYRGQCGYQPFEVQLLKQFHFAVAKDQGTYGESLATRFRHGSYLSTQERNAISGCGKVY